MAQVLNELKAEGVYFDTELKKQPKRKNTSDSLTQEVNYHIIYIYIYTYSLIIIEKKEEKE